MGIDSPRDEFYSINTNQSGPPMSARHKASTQITQIQIQILNLIHFQRNQPDRNGLVLYTCQDIYTNF